MASIKITPELLRGKASELKGLQNEHEAVMSKITSMVNGLNEQWTGEAQQAFQQSFEGMKPTFTRFVEILANYSNKMNEIGRAHV